MYLKRIELCGFKSFVERTVIEFERNLAIIVGPNGCGKSNIIDAFKWCLGEQAPSALRVKSMEDIIFNGTETRPPTSFSEIVLTFDNLDNRLPLEYSEISVARRLYRSGENEYSINRVPCRLKDIRDLFIDTGIGTEGYSIIGQGRVEFIFTAKPEERRRLFEEAAGIARYKLQKEEALRKLENTQQDLEKVILITNEIKSQMESLHNLVKKAEIYKKYKDELREIEIASYIKKWIEFSENTKTLTSKISDVDKTISELQKKINTSSLELDDKKQKLRKFEDETSSLIEKINETNISASRIEEQINSIKESISELQKYKKINEERVEVCKMNRKRLEEKRDTFEEEYRRISEVVEKLQPIITEKEKDFNEVRTNLEQFQEMLKNINEKILETTNTISQLKNLSTETKIYLENTQKSLLNLQKEVVKKEKEREVFLSSLSEIEKNTEDVKESVLEKTKILNNIREKILSCNSNCDRLNNELIEIKKGIAELQAKIESSKILQKSRLIEIIKSKKFNGIYGPLKDLLSIVPEKQNIIYQILAEKLNFFIAETENDALNVIEYLKKEKIGKITFIILSNIPKDTGNSEMFNYVKIDKKFENIKKFLLKDYYLKNDIIYSNVFIQGGYDSLDYIFDDEKGTQQLELLLKEEKIKEEKIVILKQELEKLNIEKENLEKELNEVSISFKLLEKELTEKSNLEKNLAKEIGFIKEEISCLEEEEKKSIQTLTTSDNSLSNLQKTLEEAYKNRKRYDIEIPTLQEKYELLNKEFIEMNSKYISNVEKLNSVKNEIERLKNEMLTNEGNLLSYEKELKDISLRISTQTEALQEREKRREKVNLELISLKNQHEEQKKLYSTAIKEVETIEKEISELKQKYDSLKEEHYKYELELNTQNIEFQNIQSKLTDEYGVEIDEETIQKYSGIEVVPEKIEKLRKRIVSMGEVNIYATEQYDTLQARYDFLNSQYQDLVKAESDLKETINRINQTIKDKFNSTFEKINENFKLTFSELFQGGNAKIALTDETNPLESGVDIIVQPPGKKLQSITLLSGGEKALAAIAFLFAFYMIKPSPVCLLDEVDANLDDANVGRFLNLLEQYQKTSQFIIISHNKKTIESADTIYGVTMEESGVSKIISIKLKKQEAVPA